MTDEEWPLICDVCGAIEPPVLWVYPCPAFQYNTAFQTPESLTAIVSDDDWALCDHCSAIVETVAMPTEHMVELLVTRASEGNQHVRVGPPPEATKASWRYSYHQFLRLRTGPRRPPTDVEIAETRAGGPDHEEYLNTHIARMNLESRRHR